MSILGLLISLFLAAIALLIVARPLLRPSRSHGAAAAANSLQQQADRVSDYYERVLTNIRDLDEDFATGKINREDYQQEREVWAHRGIRLLKVSDRLDAEHSLVDGAANAERIDQAIEAAVAAYREGMQPAFHDMTGEETTSA